MMLIIVAGKLKLKLPADGNIIYIRQAAPPKTLSAIANQIAGSRWNGFLFFGLKKRGDAASEESAA